MSNSCSSFGQSHSRAPAFGQASNANTTLFGTSNITLPSSVLSGTTKPSLFSFQPTSGISDTSVPNVFGQSHSSASAFGQASNANTTLFGTSNTTLPSSVSFGTTKRSFFSFQPTSGISDTSVPNVFGQSHSGASAFGKASKANTTLFGTSNITLPSSVSFGTTKPLFFSFPPTSGISDTSVPNGTVYASTNEVESSVDKLQSVSAMPIHNGKSHEEIRFESLNSVEKASGRSLNIFGASSVLGQCTNSTSNRPAFGSQFGGFGQARLSTSFGSKNGSSGGLEPSFGASNLWSSYPFGGIDSQMHTTGTTGFGAFSSHNKGSRVAAYSTTIDEGFKKLQSLSAMPVYSWKSHEELQLEDYNKGIDSQMHTTGTTGLGAFSCHNKGSRVTAYSTTIDEGFKKLQSLSAIPVYSWKSHEELRLEDYNEGYKGAFSSFFSSRYTTTQTPSTQTTCNFFSFPPTASGLFSSTTTSNSIFPLVSPSNSSPQISRVPFSDYLSSTRQTFDSPFSPKLPSTQTNHNFSFPCTTWTDKPEPYIFANHNSCTNNPFTRKPFTSPLVPQSSFPHNSQTSSNGISTHPSLGCGFNPTYYNFLSPQVPSTTCPPTTSSYRFPPFNPITGQESPSPFASQPTGRDSTIPPKTSTNYSFPLQTPNNNSFTPQILATTCHPTASSLTFPSPIGQFNSPSPFAAPPVSLSSSNVSAGSQTPSLSNPLQSAPADQTSNLQPSAEATAMNTTNQEPASQSTVEQLPDIAHLSISLPGSSMPVHDKPSTHVRLTSSPHLSHHSISLPVRKYDCKIKGPKAGVFNKNRESSLRESTLVGDDVSPEDNNRKPNNVVNIDFSFYAHGDLHEHEICEQMDKIEAFMPKLCRLNYYTEPSITQLAEKEKAQPGFCSRVNNFEIGRCGYGNIKFLGETDVRNLSLDSIIEFNNRELVVYRNENEKPPVGEGLNKQAEVTLLNIHCVDKKTGKKYVDGPRVEKYKEILMKKEDEQGLEFISFDPAKGEWKFKVQHF